MRNVTLTMFAVCLVAVAERGYTYTSTASWSITDEVAGYCTSNSCWNAFPSHPSSPSTVAIANTPVYATDNLGNYYTWSGSGQSWINKGKISGNDVVLIATAGLGNNLVYALTAAPCCTANVWSYNGSSWTNLNGWCHDLTVDPDGTLYCIGGGNHLFTYEANTGTWAELAGTVAQIAPGPGPHQLVGINTSNDLYIYNRTANSWLQVTGLPFTPYIDPNTLGSVAGATDGSTAVLDTSGNLWVTHDYMSSWHEVKPPTGDTFAYISEGDAGSMVALGTSNNVWHFQVMLPTITNTISGKYTGGLCNGSTGCTGNTLHTGSSISQFPHGVLAGRAGGEASAKDNITVISTRSRC
jgi:Tectonin domain